MAEPLIAFLNLVSTIVIVDVILSWVMPYPDQFPRSITSRLTAPLYKPFHLLLDPQKTGGFDFSPIGVLVLLAVIRGALG